MALTPKHTRSAEAQGAASLDFETFIAHPIFRAVGPGNTVPDVGHCVQFDLRGTLSVYDVDADPGDIGYALSNVLTMADTNLVARTLAYGMYGIALEKGVDGKRLRVLVQGRTEALVSSTSTNTPIGLIPDVNSHVLQTERTQASQHGSEKVIGITLEDGADTTLTSILFDGINGFATRTESAP